MSVKYKAIISYTEIIHREGISLQRGMNYRVKPSYSIVLMSVRMGAPYNDRWHEATGILEYEGHDEPRRSGLKPKKRDQPRYTSGGAPTENGKFFDAAIAYNKGEASAEIVQVYEKIAQGIWCDQGRFELIDAAQVKAGGRLVFRFYLRPIPGSRIAEPILRHSRVVPTNVKVVVWRRDQGRCVVCGSDKNLHFDHDIPYSKGGSSVTAENVRLLCAKHNLEKSDKLRSLFPWALALTSIVVPQSA